MLQQCWRVCNVETLEYPYDGCHKCQRKAEIVEALIDLLDDDRELAALVGGKIRQCWPQFRSN